MLAEHPDVCSVFEFFTGLDWARRFADGAVAGEALAALLSGEQPVVTGMLSRGYRVPEITYPFGRGGRYAPGDPLPWLLVTALPRLSDDPDALFDALIGFARGRPPAPLAAHYRAIFAWLARGAGRSAWIERSGSSIDYLGSLRALFPDARFLHLHRDGPEAALSMREHHAYRLAISALYGLAPPPGSHADPISAMLEARPPVEAFGRYWTDQVVSGYRALPQLDADRFLAVAFEDLLAKPVDVLGRIADFFELPSRERWIDRAAGLVRGAPALRLPTLAADEQERLAEACRVGRRLLGRVA
jgi:hypothetical protein